MQSQKIDIMELSGIDKDVNAMAYIMQDILEEYFDRYAPANEQDRIAIMWEYNRTKARIAALNLPILDAQKELEQLTAD
ncbi:MAG: hypothetical protein ACI4XP_05550 [Acutalibacteraceae bacterium]